MSEYRILMGNLGYMRGIDGALAQHLMRAHRHVFCPRAAQQKVLGQISELIEAHRPDLCCFVEIDRGGGGAPFNQLELLAGTQFPYFDIENKYGPESRLRAMPYMRGKSNGFIARRQLPFEKLYFRNGTKRLIYKLRLPGGEALFFAHFSLKLQVRRRQLIEIRELVTAEPAPCIVLGDFNILTGFQELSPLLLDNSLRLLNRPDQPTFRFHRTRLVLDLCVCSDSLAERIELQVIEQPYSDHDALLVALKPA